MVALHRNNFFIIIPTDAPSQKLGELQASLIYVINDFFSHLGNEVDVDSGAAYNDLLTLLQATMPTPEQLALIAATETAPRANESGG
jgi:hypothetical protein